MYIFTVIGSIAVEHKNNKQTNKQTKTINYDNTQIVIKHLLINHLYTYLLIYYPNTILMSGVYGITDTDTDTGSLFGTEKQK